MKIIRYILLIGLVSFTSLSIAQRGLPVQVDSGDAAVDLYPYLSYLIDPNGRLTIDDVSTESGTQFERPPSDSGALVLQSAQDITWIRLALDNETSESVSVLLESTNVSLYSLSVFTNFNGAWQEHRLGNSHPFSARSVESFALTSQWLVPPGEYDVFLRIDPVVADAVPLSLYTGNAYYEVVHADAWWAGIVYGISFGLMLFHLFLFFQTRDMAYLGFSLTIIFGMSFRSYYDGIGQWVTPNALLWNDNAASVLLGLYLASILLFHTNYLKLSTVAPRVHRLNLMWAGAFTLSVTTAVWLGETLGLFLLAWFFLMPVYLLGTAAQRAINGYQPAKIYFLATSIPLITVTITAYRAFNGIPFTPAYSLFENTVVVLGLMLFSIGLSKRVNTLNEEKQQAEGRAKRADLETKTKSEFLAKMSHEIRTPMNGVMGMAQLMNSTHLDEEQSHYNDTILSSSATLLRVIDDLLDFSKIEAGKVELESITFDLDQLVRETEAMFHKRVRDTDVMLEAHIDPDLPKLLRGDPTRIRQVLMNLVGNAFKFTQEGKITIVVSPIENDCYRISVSDTGIGISMESVDRLFKPFSQASSSTTRQYGGTGLGLNICKQLAELMGGHIQVESNEGVGSCFSMEIPLAKVEEDQLQAETTKRSIHHSIDTVNVSRKVTGQTLNILVAEDNAVNQRVITGMLNKMGHQVSIAENGGEALEMVKSQHDNWDLVFMDCEMPVLDGYSASEKIRDFETQTNVSQLPILALTAHAIGETRQRCLDSGMHEHLAKPIRFEELEQAIYKFSRINQAR